ncbi:ABC transporter ATP-binding protein [Paenirhodobacter sp.]|uniref:ABC transporter ATP-binding protein n=1 Tax=Paenirhodobacter sp. TaxID=1965326 RepID=UPI003B3C7002
MAEARVIARGAGHSHDGRVWQFRDLDFTLRAGQVMAILGPNGRGKTTLLHTIAGLLRPARGRVDLTGDPALVPQVLDRGPAYRALDMVLMGRARHIGLLRMPRPADEAAARRALEVTGMAQKADLAFDRLSGGERQMVLIARAIAAEPAILLLDEPASALDLRNQDRVLSLIRQLADAGLAVIFTTHQPDHALAVADMALLMLPEGAAFGPCDTVITDARLSALYGLPVRTLRFTVGSAERRAVVPLYNLRESGCAPLPREG